MARVLSSRPLADTLERWIFKGGVLCLEFRMEDRKGRNGLLFLVLGFGKLNAFLWASFITDSWNGRCLGVRIYLWHLFLRIVLDPLNFTIASERVTGPWKETDRLPIFQASFFSSSSPAPEPLGSSWQDIHRWEVLSRLCKWKPDCFHQRSCLCSEHFFVPTAWTFKVDKIPSWRIFHLFPATYFQKSAKLPETVGHLDGRYRSLSQLYPLAYFIHGISKRFFQMQICHGQNPANQLRW